jgi:uncharacterized protein (TIGR03435 family)
LVSLLLRVQSLGIASKLGSLSEEFAMIISFRLPSALFASVLIAASVHLNPNPLRGQSDGSQHQPAVAPQQADPSAPASVPSLPRFEVATIKPAAPSDNVMLMFTPDGISIHGVPMKMLLREAFDVEDDRILNGPAWLKNRYDIEAKVDADTAPKLKDLKVDQRRAMMLPLLQDRLNLKFHHETRELPTYALVVARGGVKMKPSAPDDPSQPDGPPQPADPASIDNKPRMGRHSFMMNGRGHLESTGTTIQVLAHVLAEQLGRTVIDKTALTGNYDYTLQWTPDDMGTPMAGDAGPGKADVSPEAGGPTLFTAVEEQLGLKLEASKGMVDVIVIDHIDLPSEN